MQHSPSSGPDGFSDPDEKPFVVDLIRSCQAIALTEVGNLFGACERRCLADVLPAWQRLKTIFAVEIPKAPSVPLIARSAQTFQAITLTVGAALRNCQALDAARHWYYAEAVILGAAKLEAAFYGTQIVIGLTRLDVYADPEHDRLDPDDYAVLGRQAAHFGRAALGEAA